MGQLAFLLVGSDSLRRRWMVVAGIGVLLVLLGLIIFGEAAEGITLAAIDAFGFVILFQGVLTFFTALAAGAALGLYINLARSILLVVLACLILDFPWRNELAVTVLFGLAFLVDGILRIGSAYVLRYSGWRTMLVWGVVQLVLAALIFSDWPIPRGKNIPFFVSISLMFSGWVVLRMGLMLRSLEPEAAILNLPMFGKRAWYEHAPVFAGPGGPPPSGEPMVVHVWTPLGTAHGAARRPVLDRYIAAVDSKGVISTGHAALEAKPDVYISHYPASELDRDPSQFMRAFRATRDNDVPGRFQPSYEEEAAGWTEADAHVIFRNYNQRRLRAFWIGYRQENTYNLTNRNCSVAVASAMDAALEGALATRWPFVRIAILFANPDLWMAAMLRHRAESMTWTPGIVLDYARLMKRLVEPNQISWFGRLALAFRVWKRHPAPQSPAAEKAMS